MEAIFVLNDTSRFFDGDPTSQRNNAFVDAGCTATIDKEPAVASAGMFRDKVPATTLDATPLAVPRVR